MVYTKNSEIKSSTLYCQIHTSELFMPSQIPEVLQSADVMERMQTEVEIQILSAAVRQLDFYPHGPKGCFYNGNSKINLSLAYSEVKENTPLAKSFSRLGLNYPNFDILVQRYEPDKVKISEVIGFCKDLEKTISRTKAGAIMTVNVTMGPSDSSSNRFQSKVPEKLLEARKKLESMVRDSGSSLKLSILGVVETDVETGRIYVSDDIKELLIERGIKPILYLD